MSRIDDLVANYDRFVRLPWRTGLAPAQRVWMAVYPPEDERRLRLHIPAFETATRSAGHDWAEIDLTDRFEQWMARHNYRDAYFGNPRLIAAEMAGFADSMAEAVRAEVAEVTSPNGVIAITGTGSLFGLGDRVKVSALVDRIEGAAEGRLLVFFPGDAEHNHYRLMNGRDGWNYHAVLISAAKETTL